MIYLDSCAIIKLLLSEAGSDNLIRFLTWNHRVEHVSSELVVAETARALRRNNSDKGRSPDSPELGEQLSRAQQLFVERVSLIAIDSDVIQGAADFDESHLRTLDAIHLATVKSIRPMLTGFVTYDDRLERAATKLGLLIAKP